MLFGKVPLRRRRAIIIYNSLEVSSCDRAKSRQAKITNESEGYARLISIRVGEHKASAVCFCFQYRTKCGVKLGVYENHVFPMVQSIKDHLSRDVNRSCNFNDYIYRITAGKN